MKIAQVGLLFAGLAVVAGCYASSSNPPVAKASDPLAFQPAPNVPQLPAANPAAPSAVTAPADFKASPALAEILKLVQAGVDNSVVLSYVSNSSGAFNMTSDQIIYLNDLGVANEVVLAMLERDRALISGASVATASVAPAAEPPPANVEPAPAPAVVEQQPITVEYAYDSLSPYGTWVEVEGYGRCWRPVVVVQQPTWQPYCDRGRWVYTDCGWYWESDYSWGRLAFHYGRWFRHARWGWCWYPDTVWAPAWVSWRSSSEYCGWAPLPPYTYYRSGVGFFYRDRNVGFGFDFGLGADCYTFVSFNNFCDPHPYRHAVPRTQVTQIINNTTIINNYSQGNNNTIINHGVPPERISAVTHTPIKAVPVHNLAPHVSLPRGHDNIVRPTTKSIDVNRRAGIPAAPEAPAAPRTAPTPPSYHRDTPAVSTPRANVPNRDEHGQPAKSIITTPPAIHRDTPAVTVPRTSAPQNNFEPADKNRHNGYDRSYAPATPPPVQAPANRDRSNDKFSRVTPEFDNIPSRSQQTAPANPFTTARPQTTHETPHYQSPVESRHSSPAPAAPPSYNNSRSSEPRSTPPPSSSSSSSSSSSDRGSRNTPPPPSKNDSDRNRK